MSKPKYSWWGYVRNMMMKYPDQATKSEIEAIEKAIEETKTLSNGNQRLSVISMVFFNGTHTLSGAAMAIHCDYETAKRWQQQFIKLVAKNFRCDGLM